MNSTEVVLPESYPTFWDSFPSAAPAPVVEAETAYEAFVNLAEDELPDDVVQDAE